MKIGDHHKHIDFLASRFHSAYPKIDKDDFYQAAMLDVWRKRDKFDPDKGCKFSTWVVNMAVYAMRNLNKRTNMRIMQSHNVEEPIEIEVIDLELSDTFTYILSFCITDRERKILTDYYKDGFNDTEISKVMGCTRQAVHGYRKLALERLRRNVPNFRDGGQID